MPIAFSCPACLATIKAPDGLAGHNARCPGCKARVKVPGKPVPTTLYKTRGQDLQAGACCPVCGRSAPKEGPCPHCAVGPVATLVEAPELIVPVVRGRGRTPLRTRLLAVAGIVGVLVAATVLIALFWPKQADEPGGHKEEEAAAAAAPRQKEPARPPADVEAAIWQEFNRHSYLPLPVRQQMDRLPNTFRSTRQRMQLAALGGVLYKDMAKDVLGWRQDRDGAGNERWTLTVRVYWRDESETRRFRATLLPAGRIDVTSPD